MDHMLLSAITAPRPFSLAGRQGEKCYCNKCETQKPLIGGLVWVFGASIPKEACVKEAYGIPQPKSFWN